MISRIAYNFATSNKIYKIDSVPVRLGATGRLLEYPVFGFFLDAKTRYRESLMQSYHLTDEFTDRSYWIPGSWHLRMVYTDGIPFHDPSQESNRAGQHQESHRRGAVLSDGS